MRTLQYNKEADFCEIVREWYEAEDAPGIPAIDRTRRRLRVKSFLLRDVDFGTFPLFGMYINGFTRQSFEGFIQKIDTNIQLYAVVTSKSYNQRSISSLANETFFSELSEMDTTRLGCPKAVSLPRIMSTVTEIHHYRSDPSDRTFKIVTSKKSVYPFTPLESHISSTTITSLAVDEEVSHVDIQMEKIVIRDHYFDTSMRARRKQRKSKPSDVSKPMEVARGCCPIRQHHKCDESKILPTRRLGITLEEI